MIWPAPAGVMLKEPTWENVVIGEQFGPVELVVDERRLENYAFAIDDYHPWCFLDSPFGGRVGHATLLTNPLAALYLLKFRKDDLAGLHAREDIELYGPVKLGQRVIISGAFTDKYVKRGKGYTELTAEVRDEFGRLLLRNKGTEVFWIPPGIVPGQRTALTTENPVKAEMPAHAPRVARASARTPIGAALPSLVKPVSFEQSTVFSFGTRNIHTDAEAARAAGLAVPIAQGLMTTGFLSQILTEFFGASWFTSGRTSHTYLKPVEMGDVVTTYGLVTGRVAEGDATRLLVEVWCRNQRGELTAVGTASALVEQSLAG